MRIALGSEYPLELKGGVSILCRALAEGLAPHHEIVLISPDSPEALDRLRQRLPFRAHLPWDPQRAGRAQSRALAEGLRRAGVDLVHFHFGGNFGWGSRVPDGSPIPHAARRGLRVFTSVHSVVNLLTGYCSPFKPAWFKLSYLPVAWAAKLHLLSHVERELAASQHDLVLLRRWYGPYAEKLGQCYHSRLSETPPAPDSGREPLIGNVGHIARRKGQSVLVEAFARIAPRFPEWKLALVGHFAEEETEQTIRRQIQAHGLQDRVLLPGPVEDVAPWLRRMAVYVQPSFEEALGLALQEAMFHGCACVGSRTGGIPELLEPGTGQLVPPGDAAALARELERLITQPETRGQLGRSAAVSVRRRGMTAGAMVQHHLALYERRR